MKAKFEMSGMGESTFFLGLQVKKNLGGIFIHQEKYVHHILKKFDLESVRTATTPYEAPKPKPQNEPDDAVNQGWQFLTRHETRPETVTKISGFGLSLLELRSGLGRPI